MFDFVAETNRLLGSMAGPDPEPEPEAPKPAPEPEELVCIQCDQNWGESGWSYCPECGGELVTGRERGEQLADENAERRMDWALDREEGETE